MKKLIALATGIVEPNPEEQEERLRLMANISKLRVEKEVSPEEIQERAMDATIHAMNIRDTPYHKARGGMHYDTLKGWCYLAVINELYRGQQKFEDRLLSLDEHIEEKGEDISWERKV